MSHSLRETITQAGKNRANAGNNRALTVGEYPSQPKSREGPGSEIQKEPGMRIESIKRNKLRSSKRLTAHRNSAPDLPVPSTATGTK